MIPPPFWLLYDLWLWSGQNTDHSLSYLLSLVKSYDGYFFNYRSRDIVIDVSIFPVTLCSVHWWDQFWLMSHPPIWNKTGNSLFFNRLNLCECACSAVAWAVIGLFKILPLNAWKGCPEVVFLNDGWQAELLYALITHPLLGTCFLALVQLCSQGCDEKTARTAALSYFGLRAPSACRDVGLMGIFADKDHGDAKRSMCRLLLLNVRLIQTIYLSRSNPLAVIGGAFYPCKIKKKKKKSSWPSYMKHITIISYDNILNPFSSVGTVFCQSGDSRLCVLFLSAWLIRQPSVLSASVGVVILSPEGCFALATLLQSFSKHIPPKQPPSCPEMTKRDSYFSCWAWCFTAWVIAYILWPLC